MLILLICWKLTNLQGKIDTKNQPNEVSMWFKNRHKYDLMPKITSLAEYKASWQKWWWVLQPKWHPLDDGSFLQKVPDVGEEWEDL